ncbi:NifB/NifX family molybdenum-iron cluster-binding protein [uncultured Desulfobacter sp.]|uniref:NifB/NifX family molybdenum-iron cluster-binding protein n=1 Tax=uncultured Desulfobacter sp. TaxID=240139 RepID=UPI0029C68005|nr:NifB/NifX family molybdenum-iron cluster-binding protein [uncultured Desulfobacter sp.]
MKLCITATGKDINANVDTRFGRAPWFLIIDTDTDTIIEAVENHAATQGQGAGISATNLLSDKNIDAILTGVVGPNAAQVFQKTEISLVEGLSPEDTVQEALFKFKQDSYAQAKTTQSTDAPQGQGGMRGRGIAGGGRGMGGGGGQGMGGGSGQGRGMGGGGGRRK